MRLLRLSAALALWLLAAPAAHAAWSPPVPLADPARYASASGLAVSSGDRAAVLLNHRRVQGSELTLRRIDRRGRPGKPVTVARSNNFIAGEGLFSGPGSDLVAGWLEIVNGSRRPVVATGPRLADLQLLAAGPRSTQIMDLAANRRGEAVVAFWRYSARNEYSIYAAHRSAGGRFEPAQLLVAGNVGDPAVAIDETGAAVVSWVDKLGLTVVADRPAAASAFRAPVTIASPSRPNGDVGVAIENGRVMVSWVTAPRSGPNVVLVTERRRAAEPFAAPMPISVPGITAPRQAPEVSLGGGRAIVAWTQRTAGIDRAAFAILRSGGEWQAPVVLDVGASVVNVGLLGSTATRPPLLSMTTNYRGLYTATIGDDGALAPVRRLGVGRAGAFSFFAQGEEHTWVATTRNLGNLDKPTLQPVLFESTP